MPDEISTSEIQYLEEPIIIDTTTIDKSIGTSSDSTNTGDFFIPDNDSNNEIIFEPEYLLSGTSSTSTSPYTKVSAIIALAILIVFLFDFLRKLSNQRNEKI